MKTINCAQFFFFMKKRFPFTVPFVRPHVWLKSFSHYILPPALVFWCSCTLTFIEIPILSCFFLLKMFAELFKVTLVTLNHFLKIHIYWRASASHAEMNTNSQLDNEAPPTPARLALLLRWPARTLGRQPHSGCSCYLRLVVLFLAPLPSPLPGQLWMVQCFKKQIKRSLVKFLSIVSYRNTKENLRGLNWLM